MKSNETWTWNHKNSTYGREFGITFNDEYHNDIWGNGSVTFEIHNYNDLEGTGEITFTKPKDIEDMAEFLTHVAKKMRSILEEDSQN